MQFLHSPEPAGSRSFPTAPSQHSALPVRPRTQVPFPTWTAQSSPRTAPPCGTHASALLPPASTTPRPGSACTLMPSLAPMQPAGARHTTAEIGPDREAALRLA